MTQNLIKISEAMKRLNVSRRTLYNWNKKNIITFVKSPSGGTFVAVDDLFKKNETFNGTV